jgi:hypothetical protein
MTITTADRIEFVRDELKSIRAELASTGSTPHAELHDIVKSAEKSITLNDSVPTYLAELRA